MKVVRADCGDFYCGCGGGHVLGLARDDAEVSAIIAVAEGATSYDRKRWIHGFRVDEMQVGIYDPPHVYDKEKA
jgi:hypothetical protein